MKHLKQFENNKDFNPEDYIKKDYRNFHDKLMEKYYEIVEMEKEFTKRGYWEDGCLTADYKNITDEEQEEDINAILVEDENEHYSLIHKLYKEAKLFVVDPDEIDEDYERFYKKRYPDRWEAKKFNF